LQELERQKQALEALRENPEISQKALDGILLEIDRTSSKLFSDVGQDRSGTARERMADEHQTAHQHTGGVCEFDLPSYHYWLHQGTVQRRHDLETWLARS